MNAQELYDELKAALDYFGLRWDEKDKITVTAENGLLTFWYEGKSISLHTRG